MTDLLAAASFPFDAAGPYRSTDDGAAWIGTIEGGGHCWPGDGTCLLGSGSTDLDASERIADLFASQVLP